MKILGNLFTILQRPFSTLMAFLLAGCGCLAADGASSYGVHSLMSHNQCAYAQAGLHLITHPEQWAQLPLNRRPLVKPQPYPASEGQWLLLIAMGRKPTTGFGLTLSAVEKAGDTLKLRVSTRTPAPGMVRAQMITEPCLVVSVPREGWQQITVSGVGSTIWSLSHP